MRQMGIRCRAMAGRAAPSVITGDRYLSPDGDDSADGLTRATAWATPGKLNTWIAGLGAGDHSAVVMAGAYTVNSASSGSFLDLANTTLTTLRVDFEEGVTVDSSASTADYGGVKIGNTGAGAAYTVNLRGAGFTGNGVGSANGIGTTNVCHLTVNGAAADGTRAVFSGYDDGCSFHGTSGTVDKIQLTGIRFTNGSKSAFLHVNAACGTHTDCVFEGKTGAASGIGGDNGGASLSSVASRYVDCVFTPATDGQACVPSICEGCVLGTLSLGVGIGNATALRAFTWTDCFLNTGLIDGPGPFTWTRCYGYLRWRVRGTAAQFTATIDHCIFEGITNSTGMSQGSFDPDGLNWLGGVVNVVDSVIYDYGTAFSFASTTQRDHMNADWSVTNCAMFENATNFQSGLTLGTNLVTTDPLLGARDSTEKSAWGYGSGSPCIGAGTGGGNIGFPA